MIKDLKTQTLYTLWLVFIQPIIIPVSIISFTVVLYHDKLCYRGQRFPWMMDCILKHIYKAVCLDKKSNPFSILQTVLMTYSSYVDISFCGSLSVMLPRWRLLERWFMLDSFQECLVTRSVKRFYYKAVLVVKRQDYRKVLKFSCVALFISIYISKTGLM